ncbi:hypothetical protein MTR67_049023, partial [Solanum verrucosum]
MPPRRVGRGRLPRRYVVEQELPYALGVQPQGEVSNAEFRETIMMLSQAVTNQIDQQRGARHEGADTSRIRMLRGLSQHPSQYFRGFIDSQPGQGFAWGQQWSPGAGPAQGVGSGLDSIR